MDLCEETYNIWSNVSNKTQCMHHCIWCCCHWCQMGLTDFLTSIHMILLRRLCWSFSSCSLETLPSTLSLLLKCSILLLPTNQEENSSCQIAKKPIYMPCHAMPCMWSWRKMRVFYGRIQVCSLYDVCRNCRFLQMGFQCFCHRQARVVSDCKLSIFCCMTSCIIIIWVDDPPSSRPQLCCSCCCPVGWFDELKPSPRSSSYGELSPWWWPMSNNKRILALHTSHGVSLSDLFVSTEE